jgi:ABC-type Zn uptake system ZnuABC Zn-binding protein ZnuA
VTSHAAFGYLADAYGLRQVALAGVVPEAEPSARALEALVDEAVERHVQRLVLVRGSVVFDGRPGDLPGVWHDPSHVHA